MKKILLILLFAGAASGCATVKYYYHDKECQQTGGSFILNEVYLACPLYNNPSTSKDEGHK